MPKVTEPKAAELVRGRARIHARGDRTAAEAEVLLGGHPEGSAECD